MNSKTTTVYLLRLIDYSIFLIYILRKKKKKRDAGSLYLRQLIQLWKHMFMSA